MKSRWRHSETTIFGQSWAGARSAGMFKSQVFIFKSPFLIESTIFHVFFIILFDDYITIFDCYIIIFDGEIWALT
jgi:hypothetical protein